jgi:hypothetical protein
VLDVERGEVVEKELDRMIEKRASGEPDPDEREELWKESVRRYNAAREAERRALWADYHRVHAERLRRVMTNLVEFHEAKARRLLEEG